ncbi:SSI family serine proteinase inhibitor [Glycomyces luteolus]|uniref:SSI family serine proteinase inhibitor n=1 Tax=Glycomyces luteolus TaxID=2670330 RepID=A0A9X3PB40_9ACTN|nr:SSI family serine proteinase inhibitor [Glycomyces luteolus]MDA1360422.1 SSI family serine proteinase inhibitor [Glycomyces luteolus]
MRKLVVGALAAAAILAATAAPAQANWFRYTDPVPVDPGIGDGSGPHSEFHISIASVRGGGSASITLACPQEWSEHPNAETACGQLEQANGYVEGVAPADGMCTKEYAPVRVLVAGHWHETGHVFMKTYGNRCEAVLATGGSLLDF